MTQLDDSRATAGVPLRATTVAAVWYGGARVELVELPVPRPAVGETVVRVDLATVCGSDLHTVSGRRSSPSPGILGHEAVATVVDLNGSPTTVDGRPLAVGDRVVWGVAVACGECDRCRAGRTAKCRRLRKTGHEALSSSWPLSGGYAGHALLPAGTPVVIAPDVLPDVVAAPAACATATVMAVCEAAGALTGRRVVITGAGMLGLTAVVAARRAGASDILVIDPAPERQATALRFGADRATVPDQPMGECDVLLEFSGSSDALAAGLDALDIGGVAVLAGAVTPVPPVALDPERVVRRWLRIAGVHNYEPRHLQQAVDLLATTVGDVPWSDLVADPVPLSAIGDLLIARGPRPPRTAVRP